MLWVQQDLGPTVITVVEVLVSLGCIGQAQISSAETRLMPGAAISTHPSALGQAVVADKRAALAMPS